VQEYIREGERVRAYIVEARQNGLWHKIAAGTCVGHKRIHRLDTPVTADRIRLRIDKAIAPPKIRNLAVYLAPLLKEP